MLQGRELEAEVQESKLYSDRLAALEADLAEARAAEQESRARHAKHMAELEPLARKHKHHAVSAACWVAACCTMFSLKPLTLALRGLNTNCRLERYLP